MESMAYRQIHACFDDETIAVYRPYSPEIAEPALAAGTPLASHGSPHRRNSHRHLMRRGSVQ